MARDHLVHVNPTSVKQLTNAAVTAAFLERSDNTSRGNAVRDGKMGAMVTAVNHLQNELDVIKYCQSPPAQVKKKPNKAAKPGMEDLIGALAQFTTANAPQFEPKPADAQCCNCGGDHYVKFCNVPRMNQAPNQYRPNNAANRYSQPPGPRNKHHKGFNKHAYRHGGMKRKVDPAQTQFCQLCDKPGHSARTCRKLTEFTTQLPNPMGGAGQPDHKQKSYNDQHLQHRGYGESRGEQ